MRSKEVENAIDYLSKYIKWETYGERNLENDIETLLSYISELEEKSKKCEYYEEVADTLYKNSINKDKIRDKIKELEEELDDFEKTDNSGRFKREKSRDYDKVEVLKELLGE